MDKVYFQELLKKAGINKKEFAALIGASPGAVSNWGTAGRDIPYWVETWLKLYIENKDCRDLKRIIREAVCKDEVGEEA